MDKHYHQRTIAKKKRIALIAHDSMKATIIDWCKKNGEVLARHQLCGTGTTARLIENNAGLTIFAYNSGPLGGDQQIGAQIVEGNIDMVVFFADPLTAQPHDPDVKALSRIAQVYDIPMANNPSTADFMITSPLMDQAYTHAVIDFQRQVKARVESEQLLLDKP